MSTIFGMNIIQPAAYTKLLVKILRDSLQLSKTLDQMRAYFELVFLCRLILQRQYLKSTLMARSHIESQHRRHVADRAFYRYGKNGQVYQ